MDICVAWVLGAALVEATHDLSTETFGAIGLPQVRRERAATAEVARNEHADAGAGQ